MDKIQYPADLSNTSVPQILKEQKSEIVPIPTPTTNNSLMKLHKIAIKQLENEKGLLKTLKHWLTLSKLIATCKSPVKGTTYQKEKADIENQMSKLESLKIQLEERKTKLVNEFTLNSRFVPGNDEEVQAKMKEIALLEAEIIKTYKQRKELQSDPEETTENIDTETSTENIKSPQQSPILSRRPLFDRRNKPTTLSYMAGTVKFVVSTSYFII